MEDYREDDFAFCIEAHKNSFGRNTICYFDLFGRKAAKAARRQAQAAERLAMQYEKDAKERKMKEENKQARAAQKSKYLEGAGKDFTPSGDGSPGGKGYVSQEELNRAKSLAYRS